MTAHHVRYNLDTLWSIGANNLLPKKQSLNSRVFARAWRTLFMKQVFPKFSRPVIPGETISSDWWAGLFNGDTLHIGFCKHKTPETTLHAISYMNKLKINMGKTVHSFPCGLTTVQQFEINRKWWKVMIVYTICIPVHLTCVLFSLSPEWELFTTGEAPFSSAGSNSSSRIFTSPSSSKAASDWLVWFLSSVWLLDFVTGNQESDLETGGA